MTMQPRLNFYGAAPELMQAVQALSKASHASGLEASLIHLIEIRASQINGCTYCLEMHTREARADGESQQRLDLVAAWQESPLFSERERAALAWTEAVTRLADGTVDDALFEATRQHFSEAELTKLTVAIATINVWNRLCNPFRAIHPVAKDKAA
jgi:AhpD family alkylhydroperoxidase